MREASPRAGETLDSFYRGRVRIIQSKKGYRFALDAPLLADFIETEPGDEILEMGTGNGVIALLLGRRPFRRLTAVEIQPALAALARRNVALNGLGGRVRVVRADFRRYRPRRRFDIVFSNPPYIEKATGFLSASREKSLAKHELMCDLEAVLRFVAVRLKPKGRAYLIYPASRSGEILAAAARRGLFPCSSRLVRPKPGAPPAFFLVELGFGLAREKKLRPLTLKTASGKDSAEAALIYEGRR